MKFKILEQHRSILGLNQQEMAKYILGVAYSTYKGWGLRDSVPDSIQCSVEAHMLLSHTKYTKLLKERREALGGICGQAR